MAYEAVRGMDSSSAELPSWDTLTPRVRAELRTQLRATHGIVRDIVRGSNAALASVSPLVPEARAARSDATAGAPHDSDADADRVVVPMPTGNRRGRCAVARLLGTITDDTVRAGLAEMIDGTDTQEYTPFQVQEVAQQMGFTNITVSVVRNHRRRFQKTGEHCSCPR